MTTAQLTNAMISYLTSKYDHTIVRPRDLYLIESRSKRMIEKNNKNITMILNNIQKMKIGSSKKYQISGYHQWKQLDKLLFNSEIKYELIFDEKLTRSIVDKIIKNYDSGCCNECDGKMQFIEKQVPVMYISVTK
jgi:hypothetical protein